MQYIVKGKGTALIHGSKIFHLRFPLPNHFSVFDGESDSAHLKKKPHKIFGLMSFESVPKKILVLNDERCKLHIEKKETEYSTVG